MIEEKDHWSAETLEEYSLGKLDSSQAALLEEHLLICHQCIAELADIEGFNFIHYTPEGPFYSRVTRLRNGIFFARHWGCELEGGREFRTRGAAKAYLLRSFAQMFPEHICTRRCGSTNAVSGRLKK
jgi:hypothetical protein